MAWQTQSPYVMVGGEGKREYTVICSCGYEASRLTLGQAAAELIRHRDEHPDLKHAVTIRDSRMRGDTD